MPDSLEPIRREIQNFLTNKYPQVMALKGKWGTGKTYTWKKLLENISASTELIFTKYSYVSLFGMQSLDDIYYLIFEKTINLPDVAENPNLKTFGKNILTIKDGLKEAHSVIAKIKNLSPGDIFKNLACLAVRDIIVCIDDLERSSDSLKLKDIMGLVSQLKEQRNCKLMLILNEDMLDEVDRKDFKKYAEKVIDIQLIFDPKSKECADIVIDCNAWYYNQVCGIVSKLSIKNIRLLDRIKYCLDEVDKYIFGFSDQSKKDIVLAVCIYVWCYYCRDDDNVPSIDFIKNYYSFKIKMSLNSKQSYVGQDNEQSEEDKRKEKWVGILDKVNYGFTSELDLVIADYIASGILKESALSEQDRVSKKNEKHQEAMQQIESIWDKYWKSFDDNASEIRASFLDYFHKYYSYASLTWLDAAIRLLRNIGFENDANNIADMYFDKNAGRWEGKDILNYRDFRDVEDKYVLIKIEELIAKTKPKITLESALRNIYENDVASQDEREFLSQVSSDEFFKLFKECSNDDLPVFIHASLCYNKITNADEKSQLFVKNAAEALKKISEENAINYQRVLYHFRKWGIEL